MKLYNIPYTSTGSSQAGSACCKDGEKGVGGGVDIVEDRALGKT